MYAPSVIAAREASLVADYGDQLAGGTLHRFDPETCWAMRDQLADAVDAKGHPLRDLTTEERAFLTNERFLAKIDFEYWGTRYAIITKETQDAEPLHPLWASQRLFLDQVAAIEADHWAQGHPDGILVNVLKARQLGISTIAEVMLAHRVTTQGAVRGLVAADVQEQSQYMFGMAEQVITNLPWWLKPPVVAKHTGTFWRASTGASLTARWGKSARGGLVERDAKAKGNIGRGKTHGILHLSELSTWEHPEQIDDGLMPGVPRRPRTFAVFESTAKGRYDWWHKHWLKQTAASLRFTNIFIPWYIEPDKYWLPAPPGWAPSPTSLAHAAEVERTSPTFLLGRTHRLSREQLYWYEQQRAAFERDDNLRQFLEEYPATDEECFQHAGRSIFSPSAIAHLSAQARPPVDLFYVQPAKDIAILKAWERAQPRDPESAL